MKSIANAERIELGEIDDRRQTPDRRRSSRRKILRRGLTFWPNGDFLRMHRLQSFGDRCPTGTSRSGA